MHIIYGFTLIVWINLFNAVNILFQSLSFWKCVYTHFSYQEMLIIWNSSRFYFVGQRHINLRCVKKKLTVRYTTCTYILDRLLFHAAEWYLTSKSYQQPLKRSHLTTLNLKVHLQSHFNINLFGGGGTIASQWSPF